MWQEKQDNIILPGQLPCTSRSRQEPPWENQLLPHSSGNNDGLSRKRKSTATDYSPGSTSEYHFPWDSSPRGASSQLGLSGQGNNTKVHQNETNSAGPVNLRPQFDKNNHGVHSNQANLRHQFDNGHQHYSNISSETWSMTNASYSLPPPPPPPHREFRPLVEMPSGQPFPVPNQQSQACSVFGQTESHINLPFSKSSNSGTEKAQVGPNLYDLTNFSNKNYTMCNSSLDFARPVEIFQQNFVQTNRFSEGPNGITGPKEENKLETDRILENEEQNHITRDTKNAASDMESQPTLFTVNISSVNGGSADTITAESQTTEKIKSPCGKTATTIASEKLWDGSLQLSSSVTVSAVAFFKSGEKLLDTKWSEFVEVKGKVRLEAFEKYIQDLPRSRNRGLMVISLYWKEGSSDSGLSGMKEVSKGYKKGQRVGFAHLSPGVDIYICPRSDKIITILAKYGFFKGMAAIEDNRDSMIGCVVWKKNRTSTNSDSKKGDIKNTVTSDQTSTLENEASKDIEKKNNESSETQNKVGKSLVDAITHSLDAEKPNPCLENQKTVVNAVEKSLPNSDDDDLPEYDFGIVREFSLVSETKPLEASVPPTKPMVQAKPATASIPSNNCSAPNQGLPIRNSEEHNSERQTNKFEFTKNSYDAKKKNLFDDNDDDDMPEWCPPELNKKPLPESIRPATSLPSAGLTFQNMAPGPPRAPHSSLIRVSVPLPSAVRAPFSYQTFSSPMIGSVQSPPSVPHQNGPRSSMGFNPNPVPRPQYNGRRGWRP